MKTAPRITSVLFVVAMSGLLGCAGKAAAVGDASPPRSTQVGADQSACTWPSSLDKTDAYTPACVASRTYLNCGAVTSVSADGSTAGASCTNECTSDEYAVTCGGPADPVPLPSSCRSLVAGPGGSAAGCCPCTE
jgi:hypothetical protein